MADDKITVLRHLQLTAMRCSAMVTGKMAELINAITQDLEELDNAKQDRLTFDNTPTEGSTNSVTSGAVADYVNLIAGGDIDCGTFMDNETVDSTAIDCGTF